MKEKHWDAVARVLAANPDGRHHLADLWRTTGVRTGVITKVLDTMLADGWLVDGWETKEEAGKNPPRRWYMLTEKGKRNV